MKIYIDLDGVLCNFDKGVEDFFKLENGTYKKLDIKTKGDYIKKLCGTDFFYTLEKFEDTDDFLEEFWLADLPFNILTRPLDIDYINSSVLKKKWVENNLNTQPGEIIFERHKFLYATTDGESNILIDDRKDNIDRWEANGGIGILFSRYTSKYSDVISKLQDIQE